ncbi:MAG TPA: hypothetical protein VH092_37685 [Urbifossiella sp.]|jgi:hypothetical protein|nr:hypothetical protein [Urbifossiella sp.]
MKSGRWLLAVAAVPVAALVLGELAGDWVFGVREVRPDPAREPADATRAAAHAAFAHDTAPADPAAAGVAFFLQSLTTAVRDGKAAAAAERFDPDRFHATVARADAFREAGLTPDPVGGPVRAQMALADAVRAGGAGLAADSVEVRRVVPGADPAEVIAYTRQRLGGRAGSYRWWLVRTPDGWKAFDLEDVRVGVRLSRQAAAQVARSDGAVAPEVKAGLAALGPAADRLAAGDPDGAAAALGPARTAALPRDGYAARCLIEGGVAAMKGRATEAREWADRAAAAAPGLPATDYLRAAAAAAARDWEGVVGPARAYLDTVGPDAPTARLLGTALRELGHPAEAVAAFESGLRDDPARDDLRAARDHARGLIPTPK